MHLLNALWFYAATLFVAPRQGISVPQPQGYVNDFAHVIPAPNAERITRIIDDVRAKSGGEIVVVTLRDIGQRDIADVAREIGRQWKVGAAGKPGDPARNTGVIILVVPKETSSDGRGHLRIETGYGAEGFLTDAITGRIQDEALDSFRSGAYGDGIELDTLRVAERFANEFRFTVDTSFHPPVERVQGPTGGGSRGRSFPPVLLFIVFWLIIAMLTGFVGLSTICAAAALAIAAAILLEPPSAAFTVLYVATAALILYAHRDNVRRMLAGTENRARRLWLFGR